MSSGDIFSAGEKYRLFLGDCLAELRRLPADSVDALVTDPPAGISFMGKAWDDDKGGRDEWIRWLTEVMRECFRVMKPGAHGLVWALPRTSHWTATALENAGFEVRDRVQHIFGSGFPKSLDVSKAIDKAAGAEREVVGPGRWNHVKGDNALQADCLIRPGGKHSETAPATDAAKQWAGWGTALKPSVETWFLVRKPGASELFAWEVRRTNAAIGGILCSLSSAKFAGRVSTLKLPELSGPPCDSVQWLAGALHILASVDSFEPTDTCNSPEAGKTFWSIASLWSATLAALCEKQNTFTTETENALTIALRTLRCSLSKITPPNITQGEIPTPGLLSAAEDAKRFSTDFVPLLRSIQTLFAHALASEAATLCASSEAPALPVEKGFRDVSVEDYWLIRKPLSEKTVAANVLKWGTGALNIDGTRIGTEKMGGQTVRSSYSGAEGHFGGGNDRDRTFIAKEATGRFPSHLILDEEAARLLDEQSGTLKNGGQNRKGPTGASIFGNNEITNPTKFAGDTGGASRFFYTAKPSRHERDFGVTAAPGTTDDGRKKPIDNPYLRGETERRNRHPTVKPFRLMRYLLTLITPPGGTVLDPFMGSGTTGSVAVACGWRFIGIDRDAESHETATARIKSVRTAPEAGPTE